MIDRSELLQVELFPFSDGTLFRYFSHQGRATWTVRYLHMVMIQRYYDMLSQKYDWNVEIPTYNESLTSQTIARDLLEENFIDSRNKL